MMSREGRLELDAHVAAAAARLVDRVNVANFSGIGARGRRPIVRGRIAVLARGGESAEDDGETESICLRAEHQVTTLC